MAFPPRDRERLAALPYAEYLKSNHWLQLRSVRIRLARWTCERCGAVSRRHSIDRVGSPLHVHHLTYERRGAERPTDLEVLCEACHRAEHGR